MSIESSGHPAVTQPLTDEQLQQLSIQTQSKLIDESNESGLLKKQENGIYQEAGLRNGCQIEQVLGCIVCVEHDQDWTTIRIKRMAKIEKIAQQNLQYFLSQLSLCDQWSFQFSLERPMNPNQPHFFQVCCSIKDYTSSTDWTQISTKDCMVKLINAVHFYHNKLDVQKQLKCMRSYTRKWAQAVMTQWKARRRMRQAQ